MNLSRHDLIKLTGAGLSPEKVTTPAALGDGLAHTVQSFIAMAPRC